MRLNDVAQKWRRQRRWSNGQISFLGQERGVKHHHCEAFSDGLGGAEGVFEVEGIGGCGVPGGGGKCP